MHRVPILCPGSRRDLFESLQGQGYLRWPAFRYKDGKLALRLPAEEREALLKNSVAVTSQAHRGCLSPRRCRAALPSGVARLESHRHKVLPSWLPSCRSRTLF